MWASVAWGGVTVAFELFGRCVERGAGCRAGRRVPSGAQGAERGAGCRRRGYVPPSRFYRSTRRDINTSKCFVNRGPNANFYLTAHLTPACFAYACLRVVVYGVVLLSYHVLQNIMFIVNSWFYFKLQCRIGQPQLISSKCCPALPEA